MTIKILDLDIETAPSSGWFWGLFGQNISIDMIDEPGYTMCWSAKFRGDKEITFRSLFHDGEEKMLRDIHEMLEEADAVCHYNGRKFDIPTLNTEFVRCNIPPPEPYQQIDLIETVRKRFRFTSNKLDFVARLLGIGAKHQHKGWALWKGCMRGNKDDWEEMKAYNMQDVVLLEQVYDKLLPWMQNHPNMALYTDDTDVVCPNCGSTNLVKKGMEHLATLSYQRYKCKDCHTPIRGRSTALPAEKRKAILTQSKL